MNDTPTPRTDAFERDTLSGIAEPLHQLQAYARHARQLERELAALPDRGWKPMETAPRDGTEVLLLVEGTAEEKGKLYYGVGNFRPSGEDGDWWDGTYASYPRPKFWMPLPRRPHGETRLNGEGG